MVRRAIEPLLEEQIKKAAKKDKKTQETEIMQEVDREGEVLARSTGKGEIQKLPEYYYSKLLERLTEGE